MPQLPTSTPSGEDGAEDEIKQFHQEEDECSDSSNIDVVNDIKDDLLNEDGPELDKTHDLFRAHSSTNRYGKSEGGHGMYGSPAAVIVGPHRYYDQPSSYRPGSTTHGGPPTHPNSFSSGTQIRMPMYPREERPYYEHGPWHAAQVPMPPHYGMPYGPGMAQKYGFRYPPGVPAGVPYYGPGHGYPGMPGRPVKEQKRPHVKKPLNAFMLFMKEQRPKIAAEFTLKESAAINQILGKRWHALEKAEQAKYYEMARKERAIHMQLYPGWSARDNYAQIGRKKKRPRDKNEEMNPKKCRARYGLDRQEQWCKPCRRKKKCIRFLVGADGETTEVQDKEHDHSDSDDNENKPDIHSKENLKDLVTMATKDMQNISSNLLNNNNISNTVPKSPSPKTSSLYNDANQDSKYDDKYKFSIEVITTSSHTVPSFVPASLSSAVTYTSKENAFKNSLISDTKPSLDSLKTISAQCS